MTGQFLGYDNNKGIIKGDDGQRYQFDKEQTSFKQGNKLDFEIDGGDAKSIFLLKSDNLFLDVKDKIEDALNNIDKEKISSNIDSAKSYVNRSIDDASIDSLKTINYKEAFSRKLQNVFLSLSLVSFFLPWLTLGFMSLNGFQFMGEHLWAVIIFASLFGILYLNFTNSNQLSKLLTIIYASTIVVFYLYEVMFDDAKPSAFMGTGLWIILLSAVILLLIEFNFIKEDVLSRKRTVD